MDLFEQYQIINDAIEKGNTKIARDRLILALDTHQKAKIEYNELLNKLIRLVGLYPYMQIETASWEDRYAYESFKVNIGKNEPITLHREQSMILKKLLEGRSLAISAPTSFGKSFIIDSFIAIKQPNTVVIIVPTIALTDETRRRLQQKFSDKYKIITTTDCELAEKNILIFPQERAINYAEKLEKIDILIIDEFYKASIAFDKERAPALIRAIMRLSKVSKQKYFLAPNINTLNDNPFTNDMEYVKLDYNTVFLKIAKLYERIGSNEKAKAEYLLAILERYVGKTLIYAGTYVDIEKIGILLIERAKQKDTQLLNEFEEWLTCNYGPNWLLPKLIKRGIGVHNGQMHRSLSQIQIRLFEEENGIDRIISTSSIIEGVNTAAENVILWRNKNGKSKINDFTYKNIIGRGGRMFRHFVGNIFVLEKPPEEEQTQLNLFVPDQVADEVDESEKERILTREQIAKIISYKEEMKLILGGASYEKLIKENILQNSDYELILDIAESIRGDPKRWSGLVYLNTDDPNKWDSMLYSLINLEPGRWGAKNGQFVGFIKTLSSNWRKTFPELLSDLAEYEIGINEFFKLERSLSFQFASLAQDVNTLQKLILNEPSIDISPFIFKISHAFLPKTVFQLEEYGLPRMISRKIQDAGIINLEDEGLEIQSVINSFIKLGHEKVSNNSIFSIFDRYILGYFYSGIILNKN